MLGFTGLYYGLSPHPGPTIHLAGLAYAGLPISSLATAAGFGCRANRNNAGYDQGDGPRAGGGMGRDLLPI